MRTTQIDLARLRELSAALVRKSSKLRAVARKLNIAKTKAEEETNAKPYMERIIDARWRAQAERGDGAGAWKPKKVPNGKPILVGKTGDLKRAAKEATRGSYRIGRNKTRFSLLHMAVHYGIYIQQGTDRMVARRFLSNPTEKELKEANTFAYRRLWIYLKRAFQ